jgi:tRNA(fMet)-specific endonuclease VapC
VATEYLLDTNIISAMMRGEPRALLNRVAGLALERFHLSSIVHAELLAGAEVSARRAVLISDIDSLTAGMRPAPFDADDAVAFARIRAALERKGTVIGSMDALIAAQALARGLVLVTDNVREFRRVPGLKCENWLR